MKEKKREGGTKQKPNIEGDKEELGRSYIAEIERAGLDMMVVLLTGTAAHDIPPGMLVVGSGMLVVESGTLAVGSGTPDVVAENSIAG